MYLSYTSCILWTHDWLPANWLLASQWVVRHRNTATHLLRSHNYAAKRAILNCTQRRICHTNTHTHTALSNCSLRSCPHSVPCAFRAAARIWRRRVCGVIIGRQCTSETRKFGQIDAEFASAENAYTVLSVHNITGYDFGPSERLCDTQIGITICICAVHRIYTHMFPIKREFSRVCPPDSDQTPTFRST